VRVVRIEVGVLVRLQDDVAAGATNSTARLEFDGKIERRVVQERNIKTGRGYQVWAKECRKRSNKQLSRWGW
jgi:hypothetical protein